MYRDSLLSLSDITDEELYILIKTASKLKRDDDDDDDRIRQFARGKTLVLYFEKKSTRTRLSCTVAWTKLGGTVVDLSPRENGSHISAGESMYDSFRVVADMADCIVARVNKHETLDTINKACQDSRKKKKPMVINGLSDLFHPLQTLADILTMYEIVGNEGGEDSPFNQRALNGKKFVWIGDGNNVANSLVRALPRLGTRVTVCTPKGYGIRDGILQFGGFTHDGNNSLVSIVDDPVVAIDDADFIATDTWISMGDETTEDERLKAFAGFTITNELIENGKPKPSWKFLHCLPRKCHEVTDEVFYGTHSMVFEEAENRMWTVLAVFAVYCRR